MIARVLRIGTRHHQRLQTGTVQTAAQHLHAFAVAPVEQSGVEIGRQLLARGERTPRHDGPPVGTVQIDALERPVAGEEGGEGAASGFGIRGAHVRPVDVAPDLVDDDAVGRLTDIGDQRADPRTVEGHGQDLPLGHVQHQ